MRTEPSDAESVQFLRKSFYRIWGHELVEASKRESIGICLIIEKILQSLGQRYGYWNINRMHLPEMDTREQRGRGGKGSAVVTGMGDRLCLDVKFK